MGWFLHLKGGDGWRESSCRDGPCAARPNDFSARGAPCHAVRRRRRLKLRQRHVVGELIEVPAVSLADSMNAASVGDGLRGCHARAIRQRAAG